MHIKKDFLYFLPICFILFFVFFHFIHIEWSGIDASFSSIIFLVFVTLSGFFVTIQGNRHANISRNVSEFDGELVFLYRSINVFGKNAQLQMEKIIREHYESIDWESHFRYRNGTIRKINDLLINVSHDEKINEPQREFLNRAYSSLSELQKKRKILIALYKLRIPSIQWYTLDFLALIVILTIDFLPTGDIWGVIIQASLSTVVISVLILIRRLNNLSLFGSIIGKTTYEDTIEILNEKH